jgi:hypothetical protein
VTGTQQLGRTEANAVDSGRSDRRLGLATPDRRYPSPAAQRRRDAQWKVRIGLTVVVLLLLLAGVLALRLARARGFGLPPSSPGIQRAF